METFDDYQDRAKRVVGVTLDTLNGVGFFEAAERTVKRRLWREVDDAFENGYEVFTDAQKSVVDGIKPVLEAVGASPVQIDAVCDALAEEINKQFGED